MFYKPVLMLFKYPGWLGDDIWGDPETRLQTKGLNSVGQPFHSVGEPVVVVPFPVPPLVTLINLNIFKPVWFQYPGSILRIPDDFILGHMFVGKEPVAPSIYYGIYPGFIKNSHQSGVTLKCCIRIFTDVKNKFVGPDLFARIKCKTISKN